MDKGNLLITQELASSGNIDAINDLIDYYLENKNEKLAFLSAQRFEYFISSKGYKRLAYFYQNGIGTPINIDKAKELYQKSFDLGEISSGYNLALLYLKEKDYVSSFSYLSVGVENNHLASIRLLAKLYLTGEGVIKNQDIAVNLLNKAISLGDKKGIDELAKVYYQIGDYESSFKYFSLGVEHNDLDSIYHLALSYAKGLGVKQDFDKAFKYYQLGANLNEKRCLYNLSLYYRNGISVNKNEALADTLEAQAIALGFKK